MPTTDHPHPTANNPPITPITNERLHSLLINEKRSLATISRLADIPSLVLADIVMHPVTLDALDAAARERLTLVLAPFFGYPQAGKRPPRKSKRPPRREVSTGDRAIDRLTLFQQNVLLAFADAVSGAQGGAMSLRVGVKRSIPTISNTSLSRVATLLRDLELVEPACPYQGEQAHFINSIDHRLTVKGAAIVAMLRRADACS